MLLHGRDPAPPGHQAAATQHGYRRARRRAAGASCAPRRRCSRPGAGWSTQPARCCRRRTKQVIDAAPGARHRNFVLLRCPEARRWRPEGSIGPSACSCCPEQRRGRMASIMLVSKRQRPEPERLPSQASMLRGDSTRTGLTPSRQLTVLVGRAPGRCGALAWRQCTRGRARGALGLREHRQGGVPPVRAHRVSGEPRHCATRCAMASRSPLTWMRGSIAIGASGSTPAIVDLTLRRELTYHAVSDRYVVRDTKQRRPDDLRHAR